MAGFVKVDVKGMAGLQEALKQFPAILQERYAVDALARGASVLRVEMANRAPVRDPQHGEQVAKRITKGKKKLRYPGNLKRSFHIRRVRTSRGDIVQFEVGPSRDGWYGRIVEFGSKRAAAHPFMRPALDAKGADVITTVVNDLRKDVDRAAAQARGSAGT